MGYRFSLLSSAGLSRRVEKRADELKRAVSLIDSSYEKISEQFEQLKKIKPKLSRLAVQVAKLKEKKPRVKDLYEKNEMQVRKIEEGIASDIEKILGLINKAAVLMRDIIFDADTIIYRENKKLGNMIEKVKKKIRDAAAANKIVFRLNMVRAEMKSLTLRLLQASELEEEEVLRYPAKRLEMPAPYIRRISRRIAELEEEKIGIKKIDDVIKRSMKILKGLQTLEMRIILILSSIDRYLDHFRARTYLFEEERRAEVEKKIADSAKGFEDIKRGIRKQALMLYEDIDIMKKIK